MAESIFDKAPDTAYRETTKAVSWEAFQTIVENRRSVRVFEAEHVPDEVVERCLRAALLAPNSSNLQPWEFYWIKSPNAKKKVAEICLSQPAAKTAQVLIACVGRTNTWRENSKRMLAYFRADEAKGAKIPKSVLAYYEKIVPLAYAQGVLGLKGWVKKFALTARGMKTPTPREPVNEHEMKLWAVKSTALACENLMLAFTASGYDSCPMEGFDSTRLKKFLKLPSDAVPVMVVSAGKRAANGVYGPRIRFDENLFIKKI